MVDYKSLIEIGDSYLAKCELSRAAEVFIKAKQDAHENISDAVEEYFTLASRLLRIYSESDKQAQFTEQLNEMEMVLNKSYDSKFVVKMLHQKGMSAYLKGNFEEALQNFTNALAFLKDNSPTMLKADIHYALGQTFYAQNRFIESHECLNDAFRFIGKSKSKEAKDLQVCIYITLGHLKRDSGEYEGALEKYWEAHKVLKRQQNWYLHYYALYGIAFVYYEMGDIGRASIYSDMIARSIKNLELVKLNKIVAWLENKISEKFDSMPEKPVMQQLAERGSEFENVSFDRKMVLLDMLNILTENPNEVVNKEDFVRKVWKEEYNPIVHDTKLYTNINRLRKLVEPDLEKPQYIICEKDGYRFNAEASMTIN